MYKESKICLTTKHKKEQVIAPVFKEILAADVVSCHLDTDTLGTFSGEIVRKKSALDCAQDKCEWGINEFKMDFGISNEGSFGPHPAFPFLACDKEILYFIDKQRDFHLHEVIISEKTNYSMQTIKNKDELDEFVRRVKFPSHGIIIRPNIWQDKTIIFKGIVKEDELEKAFELSIKNSTDSFAWIETDMRAHMNPSRMAVIQELSIKMANRLNNFCNHCGNPGWGKIRVETGLECSDCGFETKLIKTEIFGCQKCDHEEILHKPAKADPTYCGYCNP